MSKSAMYEIGKILSKSQKAKYTKLLGEPFDLAGVTDVEGRKLFDESSDMASMLIKMPAVREELKLTVEQMGDLNREEPENKVLKPVQRTRLAQLALQSEGASAFTRPEVIRSLRLNDEQIDQIENILNGLGEARRQLRDARKHVEEARNAAGEADPDPAVEKTRKELEKAKMQTEADSLGKVVMSRIAGVLTKAQREAFRKQLGESFDISKLQGAGGQSIAKEAKPPGG